MNRGSILFLVIAAVGLCCNGCDRSTAISPEPNAAVSSIPTDYTPQPGDPSAVVESTFDDIKFEMELDAKFEKSMLTPKVNELFGKRIRIRGYIYPTLKKRGLKQFVLVRDNLECCFGPGAALYDCILVHMEEGRTAEFSIRPVAVEGKFSYDQFLDYDGTTRAIYRLDGESVE